MKLILTIGERANFHSILPPKSGYIDQILVKGILEKVDLNSDEVSQFGIKQLPNGILTWSEKAPDFDFEFNNEEWAFIKKSVKETDEGGNVTQGNVTIIKKIYDLK